SPSHPSPSRPSSCPPSSSRRSASSAFRPSSSPFVLLLHLSLLHPVRFHRVALGERLPDGARDPEGQPGRHDHRHAREPAREPAHARLLRMRQSPRCVRRHCRRAGAADRQNGVKSLSTPPRGGNGQTTSSVRAVVSPNRPIAYGGSP